MFGNGIYELGSKIECHTNYSLFIKADKILSGIHAHAHMHACTHAHTHTWMHLHTQTQTHKQNGVFLLCSTDMPKGFISHSN